MFGIESKAWQVHAGPCFAKLLNVTNLKQPKPGAEIPDRCSGPKACILLQGWTLAVFLSVSTIERWNIQIRQE